MNSDFSVIIRVRQRFGDEQDVNENQVELSAPFVGSSKNFPFVCQGIDRNQDAILQFQSLGVSHRRNIIRINGFDIPGGLPTSVDATLRAQSSQTLKLQVWNSNTLLVSPYILRQDNILRIESRNKDGISTGNLDNFIIDNMVIFYKKRQGLVNELPISVKFMEGF